MSKPKLQEKPGVASAEQRQVILDGPDGVAVAMTPEAARETAARLIVAADMADGQSSCPPDGER